MPTLEEDALRLAELDQNVDKFLSERNTKRLFMALDEYSELRVRLQYRILDEDVVSVGHVKARDVLHRISSGEGLQADSFLKAIGEATGDSDLAAFGEMTDEDVEELGLHLLYSWYSHHEYVSALAELRPLILRCDVPQSVKRLVGEARHCYAFQQYQATYAMCRTMLEASIRDISVRLGLLPEPTDNQTLLEHYSWGCLRNNISSGPLNEKLKIHYGRLCEVTHARRVTTAGDALAQLRDTLSVIEELYGYHGL